MNLQHSAQSIEIILFADLMYYGDFIRLVQVAMLSGKNQRIVSDDSVGTGG